VETYLIVHKRHVKKPIRPKRQSLRQIVLERLKLSNPAKVDNWREEEVEHQMRRKRSKTENNIDAKSGVPLDRTRWSLEDSTILISNHQQALPSIRITIDDAETTKSDNYPASEKVMLLSLFAVKRFLYVSTFWTE